MNPIIINGTVNLTREVGDKIIGVGNIPLCNIGSMEMAMIIIAVAFISFYLGSLSK